MTITSSPSAPLFVVVGSTGTQGSAAIRSLKASTKSYRVRAITRDVSKPAAKELEALGCEVFAADLASLDELKAAFEGAEYGFAMTLSDYSDALGGERV